MPQRVNTGSNRAFQNESLGYRMCIYAELNRRHAVKEQTCLWLVSNLHWQLVDGLWVSWSVWLPALWLEVLTSRSSDYTGSSLSLSHTLLNTCDVESHVFTHKVCSSVPFTKSLHCQIIWQILLLTMVCMCTITASKHFLCAFSDKIASQQLCKWISEHWK